MQIRRHTVRRCFQISRIPVAKEIIAKKKRSTRHLSRSNHHSPTTSAHKRVDFKWSVKILIAVIHRYQKAVCYLSCYLGNKYQGYDDVVASELKKMQKKVDVQVKPRYWAEKFWFFLYFFLYFRKRRTPRKFTKASQLGSFASFWIVLPFSLSRRS